MGRHRGETLNAGRRQDLDQPGRDRPVGGQRQGRRSVDPQDVSAAERHLFAGRLDGRIVASAQLQEPPRNNEAQAHAATLTTLFVAPWARGHGISAALAGAVEKKATDLGYMILQLDVRDTQQAAINVYESLGFTRWGTNANYAFVDGRMVPGHYYTKQLRQIPKSRKAKERKGAAR